MFKKATAQDKDFLFKMFDEFYSSEAVLHPIPPNFYQNTFEELMRGDEYIEVYIIYCKGDRAGYAMLSKSYSPEAGGRIIWIEEIYITDKYRGKGLGKAFFKFLEEEYGGYAKRFRLEAEPDNERAINLYKTIGFKPLNYVQYIKDFT